MDCCKCKKKWFALFFSVETDLENQQAWVSELVIVIKLNICYIFDAIDSNRITIINC
jgi:hypothetical protein